jgi:hypothetical protein
MKAANDNAASAIVAPYLLIFSTTCHVSLFVHSAAQCSGVDIAASPRCLFHACSDFVYIALIPA